MVVPNIRVRTHKQDSHGCRDVIHGLWRGGTIDGGFLLVFR